MMMRMKTTKGMRMMVRNLLVLVARLALAHVCIRLPATGREGEFRLLRREREWDGPAGRLLSVRLRARFGLWSDDFTMGGGTRAIQVFNYYFTIRE